MPTSYDEATFPTLSAEEIDLLRPMARSQDLADGEVAFRAGQADVDMFVVESGRLNVLNPTDNNRCIAVHNVGAFSGDIDLLTRRPVIVTAIADGPTRVLRVSGNKMREVLNRVPRLGEKFMTAFTLRRKELALAGIAGIRVVGPGDCRETNVIREFLHKNFVPFTWSDPKSDEGKRRLTAMGSPKRFPAVECGDGKVLLDPTLRDLATAAGIWRSCPVQEADLIVVGAGPAGMTAAVYASSEGLSTLVLDRLGPGGQAGGSSMIENFIGFPAGLSGMELATRGVLQMLKFGARLVAPIAVETLIPAKKPGDCHQLVLDCGTTVRSQVLLVATGVTWRKLEARGAERFERAGIYYACTSVEALIYDRNDVAVVGAGNSAGQAAMFLAECCRERTVHVLVRNVLGPGMSDYLASRIRSTPNIKVHEGVEVTAVNGERRVEELELKGKSGEPISPIGCNAVFVFIGAEPRADWLPDTVARDSLGYLLTGVDAARSGKWPLKDRDPLALETTLPGILAAGDIRSGSTKRVGFAVGDGSLAVTCAHRLRTVV